ncbi:MAG: hypothetical protein FWD27_00710 [Coriobacteriia bacterium]|nr:hypothetical protein [Coriobacteriia bacterium]
MAQDTLSNLHELYYFMDYMGLPLMLIFFAGLCFWKLIPWGKRWFDASMEEKAARILLQGETVEVIRNNSAAMENNTVAMNASCLKIGMCATKVDSLIEESRTNNQRSERQHDEILRGQETLITSVKIIKDRTS